MVLGLSQLYMLVSLRREASSPAKVPYREFKRRMQFDLDILHAEQVDIAFRRLERRGFVTIEGDMISYLYTASNNAELDKATALARKVLHANNY